jgi:hypothetical protein
MLNIISRSLVLKEISGPQKVVANLIAGLEKLGYPYMLNKRLDSCERLYIHDDTVALRKVAELDPKIKVVVGPNLYVVPREIPQELDISKAIYLVPSEWTKRFWLFFGFDRCPMESWATGINTEEFVPSADKKEFILIYWKERFMWELAAVKKELEAKHLPYTVLHYDEGYQEEKFKRLLKNTRYVIWLGRQESQGIALQEVLSANVPVLVCDASSVGHSTVIGGWNREERDYKNTTSAEYFDTRCGIKINDFSELGSAIDKMETNLTVFEPRQYILEHLSLEGQARKFLGFYEKHFRLSYEAGFKEKLLREGKWLNAEWYYLFYLKLKQLGVQAVKAAWRSR